LRPRPVRRDTGSTGFVARDAGQCAVKLRGSRVPGWQRSPWGAVPDCMTRRLTVTEFYGIQLGTIPGFAEAGGGKFMSVQGLPERTVENMVKFMDRLRGMHTQDPLAFEVCVRHVASIIEDQRRDEGHTDPRDDRAP